MVFTIFDAFSYRCIMRVLGSFAPPQTLHFALCIPLCHSSLWRHTRCRIGTIAFYRGHAICCGLRFCCTTYCVLRFPTCVRSVLSHLCRIMQHVEIPDTSHFATCWRFQHIGHELMDMISFCDMSQAGAPFRFDKVCVLDFPTPNAPCPKGNKRADKKECFG